jgi:hypothetical protein
MRESEVRSLLSLNGFMRKTTGGYWEGWPIAGRVICERRWGTVMRTTRQMQSLRERKGVRERRTELMDGTSDISRTQAT